MNTVLIKSLIGIGVAGASVAGGYGIYRATLDSSTKTIGQLLKDQGFSLLGTDEGLNTTEWTTKVTTYSSKSTPKLNGYEDSSSLSQEQKIKAMQKACKALLATSFTSETKDIEAQAKEWCVISKTVSGQ